MSTVQTKRPRDSEGAWSSYQGRWETYDNPKPFTWGDVVKVHEIGEYAIVEYIDRVAANEAPRPRRRKFSSFVGLHGKGAYLKRGTSHSHHSLDAALLHCIAFTAALRNGGINEALNTDAHEYAARVLGL